MPPIKAIKNQYVGINAHLHSYWQAQGGWHEFHTAHIANLAHHLKVQLLPMGYTAGIEQSLQIRLDDVPYGDPESDVTVYDVQRRVDQVRPDIAAPVVPGAAPIIELDEFMIERSEYRALAIYKTDQGRRGEVIGWIELLSPSNKAGGSITNQYIFKRQALVRSGLTFVEIDYLNHTRPTLNRFRDGLPYHIFLFDPHPDFYSGLAYPYAFAVDDPIPTVKIPLKGADLLEFDFGKPYQATLAEQFFAQDFIDYAEVPHGMDYYRPEDKKRIFRQMEAIEKAVRAGVDLEANAPLPVEQ